MTIVFEMADPKDRSKRVRVFPVHTLPQTPAVGDYVECAVRAPGRFRSRKLVSSVLERRFIDEGDGEWTCVLSVYAGAASW